MAIKISSFFFATIALFSLLTLSSSAYEIPRGHWTLLHSSIGISAMHMQLLYNHKVIIFDRTDVGPSNLSLPFGSCRPSFNSALVPPPSPNCTAHSVIYDIASNTFRPLTIHTDTWCSSGTVVPTGVLIQTGGYGRGDRVIRTFTPCDDNSCDWVEFPGYLSYRRWYASNQILPDGRVIIVGGRRVFNYEFFPKNLQRFNNNDNSSFSSSYFLRFLVDTRDPKEENNLYPFLHLLPDGNLFIFANKRSILLDYKTNRVVKEFPVLPGNDKRNYPSTGSSALLPLWLAGGTNVSRLPEAEVMVCGGAPAGSFIKSDKQHIYVEASRTCGRLKVTDPDPEWVMEFMPMPRVMTDMLLLPTGDILLINGAANGTAGWEDAVNPVFKPVLYMPYEDQTRRFAVMNPTTIPRMYHSSALLLPDGRILVGGSNPHRTYNFTAYPYPTELSLEAFHPHYLAPQYSNLRPSILSVESMERTVQYQLTVPVTFELAEYHQEWGVSVTLILPSFSTHSLAMNQRVVMLNVVSVAQLSTFAYKVIVNGPTSATVAPPGYYMMFVVHAGIPSHGIWVKVQ